MNSSNLLLVIVAEIAILLFVVCLVLAIQNRSMRRLLAQMREKAQGIVKELKQAKLEAKLAQKKAEKLDDCNSTQAQESYLDFIEKQIEVTLGHHQELKSGQDIALDIAPESPLIHRTPALRHAMLVAEKNALGQKQDAEEPDWSELAKRYEFIFNFCEEYDAKTNDNDEGLEALKLELDNATKRVTNLEKFKKLYFDLEEKWQNSKDEAQTHFNQLHSLTSELENSDEVHQALQGYHQSYQNFVGLLEAGPKHTVNTVRTTASGALEAASEIKQLRAVAADQHKIIEDLQKQLMSSQTDEDRHNVVNGLQEQLQKQIRFVKESETCIQLLEDELNIAHQDIDAMRDKVSELPEIKSDFINLRKQYDELEMKHDVLATENTKLQKALHVSGSAEEGDTAEAVKLRKELGEMSTKYNELEEKFLDLKLQQ